jgi:shikimate kinase
MGRVRHVVLLGLMGSGKTSIGSLVAEAMGWPLVDGDDELEALTGGLSAADVESTDGIDALHELEEQVAVAALQRPEPSVIGPAASVAESAEVQEMLGDHVVVWLSAPAQYLAEKARTKDHRPLLGSFDLTAVLQDQIDRREPLVAGVVDLVVDVTAMSKQAAADRIAAFAKRRAAGGSGS